MLKYFTILLVGLLVVLPAQADQVTTTDSTTLDLDSAIIDSTSTVINESVSSTENSMLESDSQLVKEPIIRVGLLKTKTAVHFKSPNDYNIYSATEMVGFLSANEEAVLSYKNGKFFLKSNTLKLESKNFWRFEPVEENSFFNLPNCGRTLYNRKITYCTYRGVFEYQYGQISKMPYLINELPLEDYMKGIAETDNNSAQGYIKAVLVAARSYAYKNISFNPPTAKRLFDVFASTKDQLYLGYVSEQKMPRVAKMAQETSGEMVTFNNKVVTTPYFSYSGGKTKEWKNRAGKNDRPWLISVECKYDKGKRKLGHGYGMSTHDALMRATKDNWDYVQLLEYYYSGTQVEKIY